MFGLKRFRIRTGYSKALKPNLARLFETVDSITVEEQFSSSARNFLILCSIKWKGVPENGEKMLFDLIPKVDWFDEIIHVETSGNSTLCFIKGSHDERYSDLFLFVAREYLCFLEFPVVATPDHGTFSLVGPPRDLSRLMEFLSDWGSEMEITGVTQYAPKDRGILSLLTEKQLISLKRASEAGFFATPRKTDSRRISSTMGIRHTTFLTHIRRGQERLFSYLFGDVNSDS